MTRRGVLVAACALVAALDLAQLVVRVWEPRLLGALVGAVIYAAAAALCARGTPIGLWIARLVPLIPLVTLTGWALGAPVPVTPDAWMLGVLAVQLVAAAAAWSTGSGDPPHNTTG